MRFGLRHPHALLIGCLIAMAPAQAHDSIAIIVGAKRPDITFNHDNLEDIFLKQIQVDNNRAALVPINLSATDPVREALSLDLFGQKPLGMQRYWTERYFHGVDPPYTVNSQEAMLRFVATTPGAVGYLAACRVDARVQVVARLPVPDELAAAIHSMCEKAASGK